MMWPQIRFIPAEKQIRFMLSSMLDNEHFKLNEYIK